MSRIAAGLADAVAELQEFSRGIHPAALSERGLGPALRTLARRSAVPVDLDVTADARFPEPVETAAYYVASEALANAMKHAQASRVEISLATRDGRLLLSIRDDGVGGADPARGSGLAGLADRVEALGGSIHVHSAAGAGTHITVDLPLEYELARGPADVCGARSAGALGRWRCLTTWCAQLPGAPFVLGGAAPDTSVAAVQRPPQTRCGHRARSAYFLGFFDLKQRGALGCRGERTGREQRRNRQRSYASPYPRCLVAAGEGLGSCYSSAAPPFLLVGSPAAILALSRLATKDCAGMGPGHHCERPSLPPGYPYQLNPC